MREFWVTGGSSGTSLNTRLGSRQPQLHIQITCRQFLVLSGAISFEILERWSFDDVGARGTCFA